MKDFRDTVIAVAKSQLEGAEPFIWLFEVEVPTSPTPTRFRLTNYDHMVSRGASSTGNPITYDPYPIAFGDLRESGRGDLPAFTMNIANVTLELMDEFESYDGLRGQKAALRLTHIQGLLDPNAQLVVRGRITGGIVEQDTISLAISQSNLSRALFPKNRYLAHHCRFRYGGPDCGYMIPTGATNVIGGGFDYCGRTLAECNDRGDDEEARLGIAGRKHPMRFGGEPGIKQGNLA